jgi:GcrA cell cycle regulator
MEWNDEIIVRLRAMWAEGHSTAEIGRRIGVSKNAVVGKAHRLALEARPSPIRRDATADPATRVVTPRRVVGPTLPPLSAGDAPPRAAAPLSETADAASAPPQSAAPASPPQVAPRPPAPPVRAVPPRASRLVACCWPIGEPGTSSFHFCDAEALPGKPYCTAHATLAYVKVRDRREEAA